ncbi:MAG: DNA polymerase III subunit chi [Novosphingobium sp.]|nr:DNA polymerase III subunit chi [Novosphingobium sp.]
MRVDFYQLSQSSVEEALPALAARMMDAKARALVVSADVEQLARISEALWAAKDQFLAHAPAGGPHDARQPILLADSLAAPNGARFVALADGLWREGAEDFERVFLLFDDATLDHARATWRSLDGREGLERNYWRQLSRTKWEKAA